MIRSASRPSPWRPGSSRGSRSGAGGRSFRKSVVETPLRLVRDPGARAEPLARTGGFTLLELVVVLSLSAIVLTFAGLTFSGYFQRSSARRAAEVFAQDLIAARGYAVRSREAVVIRFFESGLWYQVESQSSATEIARRRFGTNADIDLSAVGLDISGDTLVFNSRGFADLSGAGGPLGTATFSSGATTYTVSFNGMGASKIDQT